MISSKHLWTFVIPILFSIAVCEGGQASTSVPFDRVVWNKIQEGLGVSVRFPMVQDLIDNHKLRNLNRGEVRSLLGEPMYKEGSSSDEDWYVVKRSFHDESNKLEASFLSISLVIKYDHRGHAILEIGLSQSQNVPNIKEMKVTYKKL